MNFTVSSPGKTILYGEHAVVYGVPAIAASLALHTYISVQEIKRDIPVVELDFPAVKLKAEWPLSELTSTEFNEEVDVGSELDPNLHKTAKNLALQAINLEEENAQFKLAAAEAFLYLFLVTSPKIKTSLKFTTASTLPIGAGLGSSASFSASLAAALLKVASKLNGNHEKSMELITKYSFLGECCIHGKPSGIDNVVATRGGAVYFQKRSEGNIVKPYPAFPELQLILTDTKVPRLTSRLVAQVAEINEKWPRIFEPLLAAFRQIVVEANEILSSPQTADFATKICELAELNHGLLSTISVSHPALEKVRDVSKELNIGTTKLTGAGGGGCAITVATNEDLAAIEEFRKKLGTSFEVFVTRLGVKGVGYADLPNGIDISNGTELSQLEFQYW